MLITNFSSGELSETLFGRIDLEQYYQGAAKIENFDIIPTGGIRKRCGTERLGKLEGSGRIIPFIVDRECSFLLYLTPLKIAVYTINAGKINGTPVNFTNSSALRLYGSQSEIQDVQYTQCFDKMVLCHENYPPLMATLSNNQLSIKEFKIDITVELVARDGIASGQFSEIDEKYSANGWLSKANEWPRTATFFNGRLIFAGTKTNPQRIFSSSVDDISKFATYKKFIIETREYIAINCKVNSGSNEVEILDSAEIGRFVRSPYEYYVDSPYFPEGTTVTGLQVRTLYLSNPANEMNLSDEQMEEFLAWKKEVEQKDDWSIDYLVFREVIPPVGTAQGYTRTGNMQYMLGKYRYVERFEYATYYEEKIYNLDIKNAELCVKNRENLYDEILGSLGGFQESNNNDEYRDNFHQFVDDFWFYIQDKMQKTFLLEGERVTLYGTPAQIYSQLIRGSVGVETIIALYTRDYTFDKYPTADCGFTFEIASDSSDAIRWLVVNKGLIVGTETGEWIIPPGVTATNVQATRNSSYGSDKIQGTAIGDATCFFQAGKKSLVEYYIPQQDNNFRANNMAIMASQMLHESDGLEFDYALSPYTKLFITREDGTLATLLYDRSLGVFAWMRHSQKGKIKSLAVVPGAAGYDDVYLLVEYENGCFLERFEYDGIIFLDSFTLVNASTWAATRGLYPSEGAAVCRVVKDIDRGYLYDALDADTEPDWTAGGEFYIGYLYNSVIRTLPVLANDKMAKQRITTLTFRFLNSYLPFVSSIANGRNIKTDTITNLEVPYSGVHKIPFPGTWGEEVQAELIHEQPEPVKILSLNAEVQ